MVDVLSKLCIGQHDECSIKASPNKKYKGYCFYCFINTFPEKTVTQSYKKKECEIVKCVKSSFPNFIWKGDKIIQDACLLRCPDFYWDMGNKLIIIEIDEDSHNTYDSSRENKRIMQLSQYVNHKSIFCIRFNPDKYTNSYGYENKTCWVVNGSGILAVPRTRIVDWEMRLENLLNIIYYCMINEPNETIETFELYFENCSA
jgi:hypothetical protein